jgi:hypothetical protein
MADSPRTYLGGVPPTKLPAYLKEFAHESTEIFSGPAISLCKGVAPHINFYRLMDTEFATHCQPGSGAGCSKRVTKQLLKQLSESPPQQTSRLLNINIFILASLRQPASLKTMSMTTPSLKKCKNSLQAHLGLQNQ